MKKTILAIAFLSITIQVIAQRDYSDIVKVNLTDFILSTATIKYERVLHDRLSFEISGSYSYKNVLLWNTLNGNFKGPAAGIQLRYYFPTLDRRYTSSNAPEGLYAALWSKWDSYNMHVEAGSSKIQLLNGHSFSGGVNIGYQFWCKDMIFLDIYAGGGFISSNYSGKFAPQGRLIVFNNAGFVPKLGINIGYPF